MDNDDDDAVEAGGDPYRPDMMDIDLQQDDASAQHVYGPEWPPGRDERGIALSNPMYVPQLREEDLPRALPHYYRHHLPAKLDNTRWDMRDRTINTDVLNDAGGLEFTYGDMVDIGDNELAQRVLLADGRIAYRLMPATLPDARMRYEAHNREPDDFREWLAGARLVDHERMDAHQSIHNLAHEAAAMEELARFFRRHATVFPHPDALHLWNDGHPIAMWSATMTVPEANRLKTSRRIPTIVKLAVFPLQPAAPGLPDDISI